VEKKTWTMTNGKSAQKGWIFVPYRIVDLTSIAQTAENGKQFVPLTVGGDAGAVTVRFYLTTQNRGKAPPGIFRYCGQKIHFELIDNQIYASVQHPPEEESLVRYMYELNETKQISWETMRNNMETVKQSKKLHDAWMDLIKDLRE